MRCVFNGFVKSCEARQSWGTQLMPVRTDTMCCTEMTVPTFFSRKKIEINVNSFNTQWYRYGVIVSESVSPFRSIAPSVCSLYYIRGTTTHRSICNHYQCEILYVSWCLQVVAETLWMSTNGASLPPKSPYMNPCFHTSSKSHSSSRHELSELNIILLARQHLRLACPAPYANYSNQLITLEAYDARVDACQGCEPSTL